MLQQLSGLDYDDSFEYDEIDLQHIQQSRGPKLRCWGMRQSEGELNPMIWAEVLRQDVKALWQFIGEERGGLRTLLGDMGSVHRTEARESLTILHGFRGRSSELDLEMAKWDEEFPKNPTLVEGVIAFDENRGNSRTRTELRQSKKTMMDLLHRPDVLNIRERRQHHLVHSKLGGGIYDPPDSNWDGTRYKNTLLASLRSKLTLKIHFQALVHMATTKRNARKACDKYYSTRSKQFLKLCFQSLKYELIDSLHSRAHANAVARMLEQQKYLYPALHAVQGKVMHARHHHQQLKKAEHFDHWWYLIHGFSKVERFHSISRAAIECHTLAVRFYFREHTESSLASLHEHKRLMLSLRNVKQAVHVFRMETAGKAHFRKLSKHVYLLRRLERCHQLYTAFRRNRQVVEPWQLLRTVTRELAEERTAYEAGMQHRRLKQAYSFVATVVHFHRKRQALRKWHYAGRTFHMRKELALAMHRVAGMAGYCLYLKTCMHRGFCFYRYNALQDALSILQLKAQSGSLGLLGGAAAADWAYQKAKRLGLRRFKQQLALSRRARLVSKWAPERSMRARMNRAYQAWIYAYVKRCALKITLQKRFQKERSRLSDNPRDAMRLRQAADWKEEMMTLEHHRSDKDVQELEHSLVQLRAQAAARLVDSRVVDFTIIRTKLKAVRALSAPQSLRQAESDLNLSIEDKVHEVTAGRVSLDQDERGLSSYIHAYSRHKVTRGLVDGLSLAFHDTTSLFEECVTKTEDGIISGINVGPGVRAGFTGAHATGIEAAGTLAETEVRSGMELMLSGIHRPHVDYTSHMPAHHDSHHQHHVPLPLRVTTGTFMVHSGVSSVDTTSSGLSTRSLRGGHLERSLHTSVDRDRHHSQPSPPPTHPHSTHAVSQHSASAQPTHERGTRHGGSHAQEEDPVHVKARRGHTHGKDTPHYLQSTAAADGWAAGHAHIAPHLRPDDEPHLAHTVGASLQEAHKDAHQHAAHHHDGHELPSGAPHYLQSTTASELNAAQHPHPHPHPEPHHGPDIGHSRQVEAAKPHALQHALHHHDSHPLPAGVPHYLQGTTASEQHSTQHPHRHEEQARAAPKPSSHLAARAHVAKGSRRGVSGDKAAREARVSPARARERQPTKAPAEAKTKAVKKTVKISETAAAGRASRAKNAAAPHAASTPAAKAAPGARPAAADLSASHVKKRVVETRKAVLEAIGTTSRLDHYPNHPEAEAHHQHRVRARKHPTHRQHGHEDSSDGSGSSEDIEAWRDAHDLTQIVSRAELYKCAEASTDEGGEGSYDASQSMHRSSRQSPGVVWARDEEEVRADMEATATTAVYQNMNRSDPPPLLRFFKSAVSLGTTEKRRPRAAAAAREEKSDYLLAEDDEEDIPSSRPLVAATQPHEPHHSRKLDKTPHPGAAHAPLEMEMGMGSDLDSSLLQGVGVDLLERSMNLSVASGVHDVRAHRLEASFSVDHHQEDLPVSGAAFALDGISLIEDDEDDEVDAEREVRPIVGHDPHTMAMFRDPESKSRRRLEMFEVAGTLDDALRLVTESRWAFSKLRRHARLARYSRVTRQGNVRRRLFYCLQGWRHLFHRSMRQLELCDAVFRQKALARSVRHLHYHGYVRLQALGKRLAAKALRGHQRRSVRLWWSQTRTILAGYRAARVSRVHTLRKKWDSWAWCTRYLPGMSAVRRKVTRRVCLPLLYRWRAKVGRRKKLKRAFAVFYAAWDSRLERTVLRSNYLRTMDVFGAWRYYVEIAAEEKAYRKKREMAFIFRGQVLTSKCWYSWLVFHGRAQAVKRAVTRQQHMEMRLCLAAMRNEATDTKLALQEARHHRSFFLRLHAFLCWHEQVLAMQYRRPRRHYQLKVFRLFFDEVRTAGRATEWNEVVAMEQQRARMKRLMQNWKGVVIRRMRIRIGLGKLHDSWVRHMGRAALVTWPGRASFAKGEAMRRRLEEKGRARIVLVDRGDKEKERKEEEKKRKQEEEARKAKSFIEYRRKAPVQQRAQLLGIIYSMDDHHAVASLFMLLRTVLVMWQETSHSEKLLRGQKRLVTFRHKRFLLEHHLRKWMNRCSATSHRVALWIQAKYEQKHSTKMAAATSAIATQRLVEEYARLDVEPDVHTTIGGVIV